MTVERSMGLGALPGLDDDEGAKVPEGLRVFDAHVHLFPERVFDAIWRWFGQHAWPIRYRLYSEDVVRFLTERGVQRFTALVYAHRPGMAGALNQFVHELGRAHSQVVPLGTVLPGEPDAEAVVRDALGRLKLRGLKLHCHVQRMAPDAPALDVVYRVAEELERPVVIHAGREPNSKAYGLDTRELCGAPMVERVLQRFPRLKLVVPHLGADEFEAYEALMGQFENLYLDTTMMVAGYFPIAPPESMLRKFGDRLLYGTDFPNIPYAWDRELRLLQGSAVPQEARDALFWGNAERLFAEG